MARLGSKVAPENFEETPVMKIVDFRDSERGNTNSLSACDDKKEKKGRQSGSMKWPWTWNNYPEDWEAQLAPAFAMHNCKWFACMEIGEECGTPHLQGYAEWETKVRPIGYKGIPKTIHWGDKDGKPARGTTLQNLKYCSKDPIGGFFFGNLKPPRKLKHPVMDLWWEEEILEAIKEEPDDRTLHWYWSKHGNIGKTTFCKFLCDQREACILSGKSHDVKNGALTWMKDKGTYPDLCIFPIPRSYSAEYLSYEALESVKDALFYSGKYEGGTVCAPCPHVYVFCNFPPDYEKLSQDRWHVVQIDAERSRASEAPLPPALSAVVASPPTAAGGNTGDKALSNAYEESLAFAEKMGWKEYDKFKSPSDT